MYIIYGLPMETHTAADLLNEIDEEIVKIQTDLISEKDYQKLQNQFENQYVDNNSNVENC
jgi:3-keto-L-gulonate-6-phosphate decarboxylase